MRAEENIRRLAFVHLASSASNFSAFIQAFLWELPCPRRPPEQKLLKKDCWLEVWNRCMDHIAGRATLLRSLPASKCHHGTSRQLPRVHHRHGEDKGRAKWATETIGQVAPLSLAERTYAQHKHRGHSTYLLCWLLVEMTLGPCTQVTYPPTSMHASQTPYLPPLGPPNASNPKVFMDVTVGGQDLGRVVMELKDDVVPRTR